MKIGISSLLFNIEETLDICKKIDRIKHIELGIDNIEECKSLYKYKDIIRELGLSLGIHLPMELNTCENVKHIRNSWIEFIKILDEELKDLDIKYFNLHLGYVMPNRLEKNKDNYLNNSVEFLQSVNQDVNINISIENVYSKGGDFSNVGNITYDFEYIFSKIKSDKLWFCYDTGHDLINTDEYINKLNSKIKIVHLSDNDGIYDIHIGIGKGILSKEHIKEVLRLNPKYMVLEINHEDIECSLKKLDSIIKEV